MEENKVASDKKGYREFRIGREIEEIEKWLDKKDIMFEDIGKERIIDQAISMNFQ